MKPTPIRHLTTYIFYITTCILLLVTATHAQTIRIADNNVVRPTGTNVYSALQAAINAAQPGDIVYITPSNTTYEDVTLSKRITLQGVGLNVGLGDRSSKIGTLTLISSSDGVTSVSGSVIRNFSGKGIVFSSTSVGTPIFENITIEQVQLSGYVYDLTLLLESVTRDVNNVVIRNSSFYRSVFSTQSLARIRNLYIYNNVFYQASIISTSGNIDNCIVSNNIIRYRTDYGPSLGVFTFGLESNTRVLNNLFTSSSGDAFSDFNNTICNNNIFYGINPSTSAETNYFRNNTFSNNLVTSTVSMPPTATGGGTNNGLGNLTGLAPSFVSVASPNWDATYDYSLNPSSPAKNAGTDGTDIGPTGGGYPINKNIVFGPAALPLITELNTSGVMPQNQPLKVNLKAKSN